MVKGGGGMCTPGFIGHLLDPPPTLDLADFGLSDAPLQRVVAAAVGTVLPSLSPATPVGRSTALLLLHLQFSCRVVEYGVLDHIWEEVARVKLRMEVLVILNKELIRGIHSFWRFFEKRAHCSAFLPLLTFINKVSFMNPSLDPDYSGGGGTPWVTRQGTVEASTRMGLYASLLEQQVDGRLASMGYLRTAA